MKKNYINPQIEIIQLKANQTLLAGSIRYNSQEDTYSVGGFSEGHQESDIDL